jgi:hypothetical protein
MVNSQQFQIQKFRWGATLARPHPSPLPSLGEGAGDLSLLSGSPSPNSGRRGWGMRANGWNALNWF